jgi:hypothetical protein
MVPEVERTMRTGLIAVFVALLLAGIAGQNFLLQSTEAESQSAITACAVQGVDCSQHPLDSSPGTSVLEGAQGAQVLEHVVFNGGCHDTDLHVVRYVPSDSEAGETSVAKWCS